MKVIFVRHGQTDENIAGRHQPGKTTLSQLGKQQAIEAGHALASAGVTHIISSPLNRALETAGLIANEFDIIPSIDHDMRELERPMSMVGHKHFSLRSLFFYKFWFLGFAQSGESYRTLRKRIKIVRTNFEQLPEDAVVVAVSHTVFINLFVAHLYQARSLWPWQAFWVFIKLIRFKNTGMLELTFKEGEWRRTNDLNLS